GAGAGGSSRHRGPPARVRLLRLLRLLRSPVRLLASLIHEPRRERAAAEAWKRNAPASPGRSEYSGGPWGPFEAPHVYGVRSNEPERNPAAEDSAPRPSDMQP